MVPEPFDDQGADAGAARHIQHGIGATERLVNVVAVGHQRDGIIPLGQRVEVHGDGDALGLGGILR